MMIELRLKNKFPFKSRIVLTVEKFYFRIKMKQTGFLKFKMKAQQRALSKDMM